MTAERSGAFPNRLPPPKANCGGYLLHLSSVGLFRKEHEMPKTDVEVTLTGENGNAFMVMGLTKKALQRAGHGDLVEEYLKEAMSGDYDHLLQTTMQYVNVS